MKLSKLNVSLLTGIIALSAGSAWAQQQDATDCSTAEADITELKSELKKNDQRAMKGVMGVLPIGLVVNAASSVTHEETSEEITIDKYNEKINARIDEIKTKCDLKESTDVLDQSTN